MSLIYAWSKKCCEKLYEIFCCKEICCECCHEERKKLRKSDIQHSFRESSTRLDSTSSCTDSHKSYRERIESDSTSRTDSVSSVSQISGDFKKGTTTPIIDMKPIEFWTANKENVQPRPSRRRLPSETEITVENFQRDLYDDVSNGEPCLTDEEKLAKFQLGQLHIGLQYDVLNRFLVVKIIEAKDLPLPFILDDAKQDLAHSNPYCKVSLLPDQKNSQQTSVQRKTQNPTWNEYFMFEIPFGEVQMRTLEILIKDFDKFSRHCIIGQIYLPLGGMNLIKGGHMWKPVLPSTKTVEQEYNSITMPKRIWLGILNVSICKNQAVGETCQERLDLGEILLSLNYLPSAGRLNVDIIKAKQLLQTDMIGGSDPVVKITLVHFEKPIKTKKTSCKKNTIDPIFNESISFNVTQQQLENTTLVITVWDHNSKSKDDFVGRISLGKYGTGPHEFTHWKRMISSQRSPVAQWHSLRTRQECDQVSPASIAVP